MNPIILFRKDITTEPELEVAKKYFPCVEYRSQVPTDSLVIARYSALPFYKELEVDLKACGSRLLNSKSEHDWIANFDYYENLKDYTFTSWTEFEYPYSGYDGPVVVKGRTNSRKHQWSTKMFATDKKAAINVASELANDSLIGPQGLIYRQYVPLKTFEVDFTGLRYTNEFRFFCYKTDILSYGYYWSIAEHPELGTLDDAAFDLVSKVATIAAQHTNFFVLDIAEKESGGWILVEVNDGQCSGLSLNAPDMLYRNLANRISDDAKI